MAIAQALDPPEEIDIRKFAHLFDVRGQNHLLVVEQDPWCRVPILVRQSLTDKGDVMSILEC